ncbi:hypothetical protein [Siccirubricoccus sp. G192]|uniref:hypothetical protein n=1 Tax=Siccirubricoccus sp. G192 TaxID=2849651 RepID=UPI001C2BC093|nr:hypothetical protein [Siccirubricoccus sp. G192]MBV1800148.1 hypothetical protein [Siccirubricoccus sp. G192]
MIRRHPMAARQLAVAALLLGTGAAGAEETVVRASHSAAGLTATLEIRGAAGGAPRAGELALLNLRFAAEDGGPARGLRPAAWAERATLHASECRERVRGLIQARLGRRAEIDLNAWQLVYLGDNGAVYALDPLGGNTRTRLLAVVNLGDRPGGFAEDQARDALFVALPETGEVVEVDTRRWVQRRRIAVGGRPARMALDPGGLRLWVGQDGAAGAQETVAVIERASGEVTARLAAGPGPHAVTAAGQGRAVVASPAGAAVLEAAASRPLPALGGGFSDIAWSPLAELALLLDRAEGRVLALRPDGRPVASWEVAPAASGLFPDPSGRLLLVPEPEEGRLTVIDLGRGVVAHRVPLEGRPLRVGFSRGQAYVQREGSPQIALIALGSLVEGGTPAIAGIAVGDAGLVADAALGATIAIAPGDGAALIAAPGEQAVHVYMEGMAAPSGALRTPQARPLAIMAVDRGLRETAPGQYETQTVFPAVGRYVVPVMQQGGGFLHCFEVELPGEAAASQPLAQRLGLELAGPEGRVVPLDGSPAMLRVRLHGPEAEGAWREAADMVARVVQFAGHWQMQLPMRPLGDGLYEAAVKPPRPGPVNLYVESASLGLQPGSLPHITLRAVAP